MAKAKGKRRITGAAKRQSKNLARSLAQLFRKPAAKAAKGKR
jgi:hypothetical protein